MIETMLESEPVTGGLGSDARLSGWKVELKEELDAALERGAGRWSRAIAAVGWIHLASSLLCQAIYAPEVQRDPRLVYVWIGELAVVLAGLRMTAGRGWFRSSPAIGVVVRLFGTFLILSFNLLMLNELLGWETRWYKPAWGTLSTFFFAALAWLFTPRMFIPAVQMYVTALLMIRFRHLDNLIYGVSWWLALMGISHRLRRRESWLGGDQ
jgi:hypothetical protein